MKIFYTFLSVLGCFFLATSAKAQDWPKTFTTSDGATVKIYQWQPESFSGNTLKANAAISVQEKGKTDPVFGMTWLTAQTASNGDRVTVRSVDVNNIKLPGTTNNDDLNDLAGTIESRINSMNISFAASDLQNGVSLNQQQNKLAGEISNTPPKVVYSNSPSILVLIDGEPRLQQNQDWGVEAVVNSPFTIVKTNSRFYLYGGKHWYTASAATGPYSLTTSTPGVLAKVQDAVDEANRKNAANNSNNSNGSSTQQETDDNTIYKVIVSTEPAELVQSNGEANFTSVEGANLLYVSNSQNDIFMDIASQQYYVLLSGRWFRSKTLSGQWQYVASDQLPAEFAKIPAGSAKDNVLASIAGTDEAQDALLDAQVPQTAKVDRSQVHADITYDGDPEFENIDGTDMSYAVNTSSSVLRYQGMYYSVDDGVWFESRSAAGPWAVAVTRPYPVALIPPRYPVYYMKYVNIYDVTPDYVYMGYTPGYLNSYVYGPTVVYGTGFYYRPWYRHYYYPRPYTWGFGVSYNPWFGWGLNYGFSTGWFSLGIGFGSSWGWGGGWWGPGMYRPPYGWSPYRFSGGYYGRNAYNYNRNNYYHYNNNIYRNRVGVVTRDNPRYVTPPNGRPGWGRPNSGPDRNPGYGTRPNGGGGRPSQGSVRPDGRYGQSNGGGSRPDVVRPGRPGNSYPGNTNPGTTRPGNTNPGTTNPNPTRPGTVSPGRPSNPGSYPGSTNPARPGNTTPDRPAQQFPSRPSNSNPGTTRPMPQQQPSRPSSVQPSRPVQQQSRPSGGGGQSSRPERSSGGGGGGHQRPGRG
ncbi:MAG: hypothetical protein QM731_19595 [Chitinophagaceae bacterium]